MNALDQVEITIFNKLGGVLTKKISLSKDGAIVPDGTACQMTQGFAKRTAIANLHAFAAVIAGLKPQQAIALGTLRQGLPDEVKVVTKRQLNGSGNAIARTKGEIVFRPGQAALALLDFDRKGMPEDVRERLGEFWETLVAILPALDGAAHLLRQSTSAGLYRTDTVEWIEGSGGVHGYVLVKDGGDVSRFLHDLHDRAWLKGYGWWMLSVAGVPLERSIIDLSVGSPERLVFEAAPILAAPLAQDEDERQPIVHDGEVLDTLTACPPLTPEERQAVDKIKAAAKERIQPEADNVRGAYVEENAATLAKRTGKSIEEAKQIIESQCAGVLLPDIVLEFVDKRLKGCRVGDVLADPQRFNRAVLADPIEGPSYGRTTAMVLLRRSDGHPWIKSFAHGGMSYSLTETSIDEAGVNLEDFYAYMPTHEFIFSPTRDMWPTSSIDARFPPVVVGVDEDGKPIKIKASRWLDQNQAVEQMTWAPGMAMIIEDFLIADGGWIPRQGVSLFNQYRPAKIELGDANAAGPWIELVRKVFPNDVDHIIKWFAQRVRQPEVKINHALVLGSQDHGVGKDTILEGVRRAVGAWNFKDIAPKDLFETFNPWARAVIVRISEVKDMGDVSRFELYEGMKRYLAAPPDGLPCNEKNVKQHYVLNCLGVISTTNHLTDGIYLPAEDRRHYVAWSDCKQSDFSRDFWIEYWKWFDDGGDSHIAAFLSELDISDFDPKAPPPKTPAFWSIVNANRTSEESELADVLDALGTGDGDAVVRPDAITLEMVRTKAPFSLSNWMGEARNRKAISHRLEKCGYRAVTNPVAKDGYWRIDGKRQVIYAKITLREGEQREAVEGLQRRAAEEAARRVAEAEAARLLQERKEAANRAEQEAWTKRIQAADRARAAEMRKAAKENAAEAERLQQEQRKAAERADLRKRIQAAEASDNDPKPPDLRPPRARYPAKI